MLADSEPWYLSPGFLPALYGLIGVIIGGLITAGSSYLLDRKREQRERDKEERDRMREVKRAARLIDGEFGRARAPIKVSIDGKKWIWDESAFRIGSWA